MLLHRDVESVASVNILFPYVGLQQDFPYPDEENGVPRRVNHLLNRAAFTNVL